MKPITNEDIKVLGRIVNISTENVVADASQVWDSEQKKDQETINTSLINKTDNATTSKYGIVRLAVNANDPDNNDVVTVKTLRDYINFVVDELVNGAPGTLDTFRELADALNNNPSFYTWVTNQLALKADEADLLSLERRVEALEALRNKINQIDGILTRLAAAEADIDELKACCEMAKQYMNFYTVSWNKTRGGDHVTITPSIVKAGEQTVTFTIHEGYYYNTSSGGPITNPDLIDGQYGTVTLESYTDGVYTIKFGDVQSNITMNGFISKRSYNVTNNVQHTNLSNPGPVLYGDTYQSTITPTAGYQIDSVTVTMNGQTVSGAYNNGAITVPNVSGPIVITGTTSEASHVGSITVAIQHGTPSNLVFLANGVTHTATVLPDNGYTSVDPEITTNNPQVNATVSGTTVTITGTSSTNVTININYKPESTPVTYGTVTVSPDHGTASPASFSADGTSHTITITPASGYTTTGMTATTTNSDLTVSVSGNTITVTGTSSNNATINVTVPAESTPTPSEPEDGYIYIDVINGTAEKTAIKADGTSYTNLNGNWIEIYPAHEDASFMSNVTFTVTNSAGDVIGSPVQGATTIDPHKWAVGNGEVQIMVDTTADEPTTHLLLKSITSSSDIYVTLTFPSSVEDNGILPMFNALGRANTYSLSETVGDAYVVDWGAEYPDSVGSATIERNMGSIDNFAGLSGSDDNEKLSDLKSKLTYKYFVKQSGVGTTTIVPTATKSNVVSETMPTSGTTSTNTTCPFNVSNVTLDANRNVILTITCLPGDLTVPVATETVTSSGITPNSEYGETSNVAGWYSDNVGSTRQYIPGVRHESILKIRYNGTPVYHCLLFRSGYNISFPSFLVSSSQSRRSRYITERGAARLYLELVPQAVFDSNTIDNMSAPDVTWTVYNQGTSTINNDVTITQEQPGSDYNNYAVVKFGNFTNGDIFDVSASINTTSNNYPALSSKLNNYKFEYPV